MTKLATTPEEALALEYHWPFWARPAQLPPSGDWTGWLILAGRGFGKTRTAMEWARKRAEKMPGCRGALVGRTAADVRDVLVEGESGILAVSPPWFMPVYEPKASDADLAQRQPGNVVQRGQAGRTGKWASASLGGGG